MSRRLMTYYNNSNKQNVIDCLETIVFKFKNKNKKLNSLFFTVKFFRIFLLL